MPATTSPPTSTTAAMAEPAPPPFRLLYSPLETATILGVSVRTLDREVHRGNIRAVQVGQRRKFTSADIKIYRQPKIEIPPILAINVPALFGRARSGAKLRGKPFKLKLPDVINMVERAAGRCEVSSVYFSKEIVAGTRPFAPSIDRINAALGYTPENCRLVCYGVNVALHQWGDDVLLKIAIGVVESALHV